jgi:hypothetical protein
MKANDQRIKKKKKKKTRSKRRRRKKSKSTKTTQENVQLPPQPDEKSSVTKTFSKDVAKLKTLHMFEPWIQRDELDVRIFSRFNDKQIIFL